MGAGHPECPERLDAIQERLSASGLDLTLKQLQAPAATFEDVALAHDEGFIDHLRQTSREMIENQSSDSYAYAYLDPDTAMNSHTLDAVMFSAGAAIAATDAVIKGDIANAFCAVRPPGHHAMRKKAMGFCFFNTVAVAVKHAIHQHGLERVAVVDFDVHHGNGTEDIFANDNQVLMVGFFQHPFYPYSGSEKSASNMVNIPVPARTNGAAVRELIENDWVPRLEEFKPEMIFISAGFDAHREDDLGQMRLNEQDYSWMTQRICEIAQRHAQGRIVSCLEGGYNLSALARSVEAHLRVLADL